MRKAQFLKTTVAAAGAICLAALWLLAGSCVVSRDITFQVRNNTGEAVLVRVYSEHGTGLGARNTASPLAPNETRNVDFSWDEMIAPGTVIDPLPVSVRIDFYRNAIPYPILLATDLSESVVQPEYTHPVYQVTLTYTTTYQIAFLAL
jgi:hypothetical protein